jgi:hypothetical protein
MKNFFSFLWRLTPLAILFSLSVTSVTAQVQVVRADINGNQIHMYLDHDSLQSFVNQAASFIDESAGAMDANDNGTDMEWADVLTNGNNPGMNVNYNGFSVFGMDSLTSTGVIMADSLILTKDADITGKLSLGDSLVVAGAAAFTGDVKGPRATGDDEFVTYAQLDSLSNTSPFNETYKVFKLPGSSVQTIQGVDYPGDTTRVDLVGAGIFTELSEAAEYPADNANQPFAIQTSGNTNTGHHMNLTDAGVYQYSLTMELKNVGTADAFVTVAVQNFDALNTAFPTNTRTLASESEVIYKTGTFGESAYLSHHLNSTMFFETDNADEDIQIEITVIPALAEIQIVSYSFSVSQVGEE